MQSISIKRFERTFERRLEWFNEYWTAFKKYEKPFQNELLKIVFWYQLYELHPIAYKNLKAKNEAMFERRVWTSSRFQ